VTIFTVTISRRELSTWVRAGRQVTLRSNLLAREPALFAVVVVRKAVKATSTSSALTNLTVTILSIHPWSLEPLRPLFVVGSITAHKLVGSELALLVMRSIVHVVRSSLVATSEALWASLLVLPLLTLNILASFILMTRLRLRFSLLITSTFHQRSFLVTFHPTILPARGLVLIGFTSVIFFFRDRFHWLGLNLLLIHLLLLGLSSIFRLLGMTPSASLPPARTLVQGLGVVRDRRSFSWGLWFGFSLLALTSFLVFDISAIVSSTPLSLDFGVVL